MISQVRSVTSRKVLVGFALLCACLIPFILRSEEYYLHLYIVCAINVILASSLRPMALTGQMSIGQAGFMAIGAYTSAILSTRFGFHVYGAMLAGGLAAMLVAAIIGFPLSRIKTIYFVTVTMFFAEIVRLVIFEWTSVTGGSTGMMNIPSPEAFSVLGLFQVDPSTKFQFCYLTLGVLLLILLVLRNIDKSHLGTVVGAVGQEESLASSVGIAVAHYKVLIFCVCTFFTGLAGSLYAHYLTLLNPDAFGITSSLYILIYYVVRREEDCRPHSGRHHTDAHTGSFSRAKGISALRLCSRTIPRGFLASRRSHATALKNWHGNKGNFKWKV